MTMRFEYILFLYGSLAMLASVIRGNMAVNMAAKDAIDQLNK